MKTKNISTLTPEEFQRVYQGLVSIERLKLDGKVYAFTVEDEYAAQQGGDAGDGVELYLRQGDTLREFAICPNRDWVLKVDEVVPRLKKRRIDTIYTGPIDGKFLDLSEEDDPDDPIRRKKLERADVHQFESAGIRVLSLESLV